MQHHTTSRTPGERRCGGKRPANPRSSPPLNWRPSPRPRRRPATRTTPPTTTTAPRGAAPPGGNEQQPTTTRTECDPHEYRLDPPLVRGGLGQVRRPDPPR